MILTALAFAVCASGALILGLAGLVTAESRPEPAHRGAAFI